MPSRGPALWCRSSKTDASAAAGTSADDPRRGRGISPTAGIVPRARERVPGLVERALVVGRRASFAHPDREHVVNDLVGVVQGLALRESVVTRPDVGARILAVPRFVT